MKAFLLLILICHSSLLFAQRDSKSFCQSLLGHTRKSNVHIPKIEEKPNLFRFYLSYLLNPKSLIKMESVFKSNMFEVAESVKGDKILINLLANITFSKKEKSELGLIKNELQNEIKEFQEKHSSYLKNFVSLEECQTYFNQNEIGSYLARTEPLYQKYIDLNQRQADFLGAKNIRHQKHSFIKKGWKILSNLSINEIHTVLTSYPHGTFLIVGHATSQGEIVDKDLNILPSSFFKNTQVENLVIFSCYAKEVMRNYDVLNLKHIKNYHYPALSHISERILYESKTPLNALKAVLLIDLKTSKEEQPAFGCRMEFKNSDHAMSVFLNKNFLGEKKTEILFDCELLKDLNLIEIYNLSKKSIVEIVEPESVLMNGVRSIQLKHYNSKVTGNHIVTKGEFLKWNDPLRSDSFTPKFQ